MVLGVAVRLVVEQVVAEVLEKKWVVMVQKHQLVVEAQVLGG